MPPAELVEKCAAAMLGVANELKAGLLENGIEPPTTLPAFKLTAKPVPQTQDQTIDALTLQLEGALAAPDELVLNGKPDYRLERRSYVPSGHGNGWCYNWMIKQTDVATLTLDVREYKKSGWRIAYMAHLGGFVTGCWDVLWIADDDSNYNWGAQIARVQDIQDTVNELTAAGRRILHLSPVQWNPDEPEQNWLCITWIEDGKYIDTVDTPGFDAANPAHWGIYLENAQTGEQTLFVGSTAQEIVELDDEGFRPVWVTLCPPYTLVVVVRDAFPVDWSIRVFSGDVDFDVLGALLDPELEGLVPICIDCFPFPADCLAVPSLYLWAAVLVEDPDLDSTTKPGEQWTLASRVELPGPNAVADLKANRRRILAFASQPVKRTIKGNWVDKQVLVVEADTARARRRSKTLYESNPLGGLVPPLLDAMVWNYMEANNLLALTMAMEDATGWRIRRGYTNAPFAWPDTYPESQIKIGSVSKVFTSSALLHALSGSESFGDAANFPSLKLFGDVFPTSLVDTGDGGYPQVILDTLLIDALGHRTRWRQSSFDPGYQGIAIVRACDASGTALGFHAPSGALLRPFTRMLYYYYMLNSVAFQHHPIWDQPGVFFAEKLRQSTGWGNPIVPQANLQNYSGWVLDLLALAVELISGVGEEEESKIITEYSGYWKYAREQILAPLGMLSSVSGTTRRHQRIAPWEVIYPAAPYLEQSQVVSNPFGKTLLYWELDKENPDEWYDPTNIPYDVTTPLYVTSPYGGAGGIRHEAVVPAGGWTATAPDIARLGNVLLSGLSPLPEDWRVVAGLIVPNEIYSGGTWARRTLGGQRLYNFTGGLPHSGAFTSVERSNGRKFSLACVPGPPALSTFAFQITDFLFAIGI